MHLNYFVLATCAVLIAAFPALKPSNAIASLPSLPNKGVEPMPVARHFKRQAPPDFYQGTAAWYFTLDTAEWFGLADKRDRDEKERKRKAREQKEQ